MRLRREAIKAKKARIEAHKRKLYDAALAKEKLQKGLASGLVSAEPTMEAIEKAMEEEDA